jgi:hypothetical protein
VQNNVATTYQEREPMKNFFNKKNILILIILVVLGVSVAVVVSLPKGSQSKDNEQIYEQTAMATIFAPTEHPPVVELVSAHANPDSLTFVISISGLELVKVPSDLENIVCDPYIRTDEHVQFTSFYRASEIPDQVGEPIFITYEYGMDAQELQELHVNLDLTIGPCGPDLQEMLVTPSPKIDLIANYSLSFVVPIK